MALATRIAAVSVAAPELQQIRQAFESIRSQLPGMWLWTSEDAEVVLIDVDSVHGHIDWLRMQRGDRTLISLTQRPARHDELVLMKPVTAAGLLATLKRAGDLRSGRGDAAEVVSAAPPEPATQVEEEASSVAKPETALAPQPAVPVAPIVEMPAAPTADEPAWAALPGSELPSDSLSLVEYFSPAVLPRPSRTALGDAPALTIDAEGDCYYGPSTLKPLLPYCSSPIPRSAWEPLSPAVLQGLRAAGGGQSLARLVWLQTLASSNGQLLPGMDLNARYRLIRWPLIEREYPRHFRIATIMMKGPATLTEVADQSGAALADVIDFVNAYSVTGFVEPESGTGTAANDAPSTGSLLSRLRARARRG